MKMHPAAREGFEEFLEARSQEEAEWQEEQRLVDEEAMRAYQFDLEAERESTLSSINYLAFAENWSNQKWLDTVRDTYLFDEEEIDALRIQHLTLHDWEFDPYDNTAADELPAHV